MPPFAQGKLVRVIQGEVLDVAVDIRKSSATFGQYVAHVLSSENKKQIWIPEGFAHGFLTLSDTSEFIYKTNNYYNPYYERCLIWNDPILNISWEKGIQLQISSQDILGKNLFDAELFV